MRNFCKLLTMWFEALRAYSLPISFMSWLVPFVFGYFNHGNVKYGLIALFGILVLHLATNIFDDTVDYIREKSLIDKGIKENFNFQKGKCFHLFEKNLTINNYIFASILLFSIAFVIALYFFNIYGFKLLFAIIPTIILCLLYPLLGCLGMGEIIVALIFSPLLYYGVYYVMCGSVSSNILFLSISTGLLSVAILHNHMLLDFDYDEKNRKITLCRICKTPKRALYLLGLIIFSSYLNIILCVIFKVLSPFYLITLLSLPTAVTLYKVMSIHINFPEAKIEKNIFMGDTRYVDKAPEEQKNFLLKFIIVRNLLSFFTSLILISVVITELF